MANRRHHVITNCTGNRSSCTSFGAGHNTHTVQATLAGTSPQRWRDAVVEEVAGLCLTISYVDSAEVLVLWHHQPLDVFLQPGSPVRLHEQRALLEIDAHWLSVAISEPTNPRIG